MVILLEALKMSKRNNNHVNPLSAWLLNHIRSLFFSLGEIIHTPFASLLTIIVIGIAMALPAGLYAVLQNMQAFSQQWNKSPTISLYLKQDISANAITTLQDNLAKNKYIASVKYISPEEGLKQFAQTDKLRGAVATLDTNPLPGVMIVTPIDNETPDQLKALFTTLQQIPLVDVGQLNMTWLRRLYDIILVGKRLAYLLSIIFGLGVTLIIGNTIRLIMQSKRDEINVMKLVGATKGFIRRPLLYRGTTYGILGGLTSWLIVLAMLHWLKQPAVNLANTYNQTISFSSFGVVQGLVVVAVCGILGFIGSWFTANWHIAKPERI